ncbi:hypothetical protein J6590_006114 [Homalodisca vitripennis]|nr:hypothetical protein J6590_006114 [Homalodisca vitripennis]
MHATVLTAVYLFSAVRYWEFITLLIEAVIAALGMCENGSDVVERQCHTVGRRTAAQLGSFLRLFGQSAIFLSASRHNDHTFTPQSIRLSQVERRILQEGLTVYADMPQGKVCQLASHF